jgi:hypothetical protein
MSVQGLCCSAAYFSKIAKHRVNPFDFKCVNARDELPMTMRQMLQNYLRNGSRQWHDADRPFDEDRIENTWSSPGKVRERRGFCERDDRTESDDNR